MRAIIDTNIIIDVLQEREPRCEAGKKIFLAIARKEFIGCITAKQTADIHYITRKQFKGERNVDAKARHVLANIFTLFEIIDTLASDCINALVISNDDYEDSILIATAKRTNIDCIVTANPKDFRSSPVKVYDQNDFLCMLEGLSE